MVHLEDEAAGALADSLVRSAADPERVAELYSLLGEFCHHFRNRLNCLKLSLYLARHASGPQDQGAWGELEWAYRRAEQVMNEFHMVCRPATISPVRLPLALLLLDRYPAWSERFALLGRTLELIPPRESVVASFDPTRLAQGLDALVSWRAEAGTPGTPARLQWRATGGMIELDWIEAERVDSDGPERPAPLALPIMARIISDHRGTMTIRAGQGLHLGLRWPLDLRVS